VPTTSKHTRRISK